MDISNKKTALDDSADIYQQREAKTEKQKWKEFKTASEKWQYFKEYYLLKLIAIVATIAVLGYLGVCIFTPQPEQIFYAAIIDSVVPEDSRIQMEKVFAERLEVTEQEEILFDDTFVFSMDYDYSARQKFMTHTFGGQLDVILMPETLFEAYVAYYAPLAEQLPSDLYVELSDANRLRSAPRREANGNIIEGSDAFYGIDVTGVPLLQSTTCEEPIILTIVANSAHKENVVEFIRYLFEETIQNP